MNRDGINTRPDGEEPQAPEKLAAGLKELSSRRVFVPRAVDEAVIRAAQRHLRRHERFKPSWLSVIFCRPTLATAVAAILIAAVLLLRFGADGPASYATEDLNRDGEVDILDAFQLARDLPGNTDPASDLNRDGQVDHRDVEALAVTVVALDGEERS